MADVQARREARRRRILENSESRLKKITTIDVDNVKVKEIQTPSVKTEPIKAQVQYNRLQETNSRPEVQQRSSSDLRTLYQNPSIEDVDSMPEVEFINFNEKNLIFRKWVVIILALITRYFYLITEQYAQITHDNILDTHHLNKIFLPFVIYQITEYIFFRPCIPQSGLLNMLFMLNLGLRAEHTQKLITIFRIIFQIAQNLMIYFFAFICFDQIIAFILQESN